MKNKYIYGARRVKGTRGCEATNKTPVFETLKKDDKEFIHLKYFLNNKILSLNIQIY